MSNFERFTGGQASRTDPEMSFYKTGDARLNQPAVEQYLEDVDSVAFYPNVDDGQLGIARGDSGPSSKEVSIGEHGGWTFYAVTVLREFDVDVEEITQSMALPIEHNPDEGLLVVDLAPFLEANDVQ